MLQSFGKNMLQMLAGWIFMIDVQMSLMSKCPYVQMSTMWSQMVTLVTCDKCDHMSHFVTCGHTCHMCSHLSHVFTLVTCSHTCHMQSHLSHAVTLVTCGHTSHMWSPLSYVITIFTCVKKTQTEKKSALIDLTAAPKVKNPCIVYISSMIEGSF